MTTEQQRATVSPLRRYLADGREILYFDDDAGQPRDAPDLRELAATVSTSEIRWDALMGEWTVIAGHRQERTFKPPTSQCPLCPSGIDSDGVAKHTEIPEAAYDVVVFENRFPSLTNTAAEHVSHVVQPPLLAGPGIGRCEVVVFTDDHNGSFSRLPPRRVRTVIDAWTQRTAELRTLVGVRYVYCFENRGDEIGVTLAHPHGQIYAYPFLPIRLERALAITTDRITAGFGCVQCELLTTELADGRRIVLNGEHWVGYVPFAARWPYEVVLVPRRHLGSLPDLQEPEKAELAELYLDVLARFDRLFPAPAPYIAGWEQAPSQDPSTAWHLAARIFTIRRAADKLKYLAGSESGAGVWVNDIAPEVAAARLRGTSA